MNKLNYILVICFYLLARFNINHAQEYDSLSAKKFLSMSLEELMNVKVTTASMKKEDIKYAPGIITTFTSDEINKFGANNLFEILDRFPNVISSYAIGIDRVAIRGGDFNTSFYKVLFMIDGRPVRNPGGNLAVYNLFGNFPIERIKQIEIIRGPGSVLYGTDAFEGVVNIITKDTENDETYVSIGAGEYNWRNFEVASHNKKENLEFGIGYLYSETDGAPYKTNDELNPGNSFDRQRPEINQGFSSKLKYKGLSLSAYAGQLDYGTQATFSYSFPLGYFTPDSSLISYRSDLYQLNLGYKFDVSNHFSLNTNFTYVAERFSWVLDHDEFIKSNGKEYLYEITGNYHPSTKINFLGGIVFNRSTGEKSVYLRNGFDKHIWSVFGQLDYWFNKYLKIIVGAQFNKLEKIDGTFVPRLGAIYQITNNIGIKAILSQAFRSPNPYEVGIDNLNLQKGNPNLTSELVTTYDLQFFYNHEKIKSSLTGYLSYQKDLIVSVDTTLMVNGESIYYQQYYVNRGELKSSGIEFETKIFPLENWYATSSFIYQTNRNELDVEDYNLSPNYNFKLGISYDRPEFTLSIFYNYTGAYQNVRIRNPEPNVVHPEPDSFTKLTAHLAIKLNRVIKGSFPETTIELHGTNLLNTKAYQPDYLWAYWNSAPGLPGKAINLKVSARF